MLQHEQAAAEAPLTVVSQKVQTIEEQNLAKLKAELAVMKAADREKKEWEKQVCGASFLL